MQALKHKLVPNQVVNSNNVESIRHMLLASYKEADLKTKTFIKPILDRFENNGCISPSQLSYVAGTYIKLVLGKTK